jgi:hypothetical protein
LTGRKAEFDLKEEVKRNHPSSSATRQNAPWKQKLSLHPDESELT